MLSTKEGLDKEDVARARADASIRLPASDPVLARNQVLWFLIKKAPNRALLRETRVVLDLMAHGAAAILCAELVRRLTFSQISRPDATKSADQIFNEELDGSLQQLLLETEFTSTVAVRLLEELRSLLWVDMADQLILSRRYELNDFGVFELSRDRTDLKVAFLAAPVLVEGIMPQVRFQVSDYTAEFRASAVALAVMRACQEELVPYLMEFAEEGPTGQIEARILGRAIGPVMLRFRKDPEIVKLAPERMQAWLGRGRRDDLPGLLGQVAAHATYYTYVLGFAHALHAGSSIDIETVGRFQLRNGKIEFQAADSFLRLLRANFPQGVTAHA